MIAAAEEAAAIERAEAAKKRADIRAHLGHDP